MSECLARYDRHTIQGLKSLLRREVRSLFKVEHDVHWKQPIIETINELRELGVSGVFFGGTLRSLLWSRLFREHRGRPRDIDIVLDGVTTNEIAERFGRMIERRTRFGGFKLKNDNWEFDVWPLESTWALRTGSNFEVDFSALPYTTFFNLEAIAMDTWTVPGRARKIYSGNDQFFQGILDRTIEVNLEENPFPELCVTRGLILAALTEFYLGRKFVQYILRHGLKITAKDFEKIQHDHYGMIRVSGSTMREWVTCVDESCDRDGRVKKLRLPMSIQLPMPDSELGPKDVHVRNFPRSPHFN